MINELLSVVGGEEKEGQGTAEKQQESGVVL
jgi:hypothetical protein